MVYIEKIEKLLNESDNHFNGSKDWSSSDSLGKIEYLIEMVKILRCENDRLYSIIHELTDELNDRKT